MEKILIIDDNHVQSRLCEIALRGEGYEVITAHNGRAALLEARVSVPDIIVLDIMTGDIDMDGLELLGKLVSCDVSLPIIIYTSTDELRENFMTWCAEAYLTKASGFEELKDKIRELLDRSKNVFA